MGTNFHCTDILTVNCGKQTCIISIRQNLYDPSSSLHRGVPLLTWEKVWKDFCLSPRGDPIKMRPLSHRLSRTLPPP